MIVVRHGMNKKIYIYILGRDMICLATTDINEVFEMAKRNYIGEDYFGGWRRIEVWEDGRKIETITANANHLVKMPKDAEELWQMLNLG